MICIQKMYGFLGLNHQIIKKSWDVTPVTDECTEDWGGKWKIEQCSVRPETAISICPSDYYLIRQFTCTDYQPLFVQTGVSINYYHAPFIQWCNNLSGTPATFPCIWRTPCRYFVRSLVRYEMNPWAQTSFNKWYFKGLGSRLKRKWTFQRLWPTAQQRISR